MDNFYECVGVSGSIFWMGGVGGHFLWVGGSDWEDWRYIFDELWWVDIFYGWVEVGGGKWRYILGGWGLVDNFYGFFYSF